MDKIIYFIEILKNRIGLVILFCFLILSIFTYQDYGLSWDEPCQQDFGQLGFEKVFEKKINKEYTRQKQYYGVAYEMVLVGFQKVFSIKESSNIYYFRHFFTHLIFLFSTFVFYLILKKTKYKNIAFLGMLFLLLSPRIYAHSFFNPKDIPLLSFTLFSAYFMQNHIYNPRWLTLILIAFFCAFVVNVRVIGVFIPGILLFFYVFQMKELNWKTKIIQVLSFCFLVMFFTILMWPLLIAAVFIYWMAFDMLSRLSPSDIPNQKIANIGDNRNETVQNIPKDIALMLNDIVGDSPDPSVMYNRFIEVKAEYFPYIDRRLNFLSVLTGITPLIGLLGTVMGMLTTFSQMNQTSVKTLDLMAGGVSQALITTQTGLIVAVPSLFLIMIIHNRRNKLMQFFQQLEIACYVNIVQSNNQKAA